MDRDYHVTNGKSHSERKIKLFLSYVESLPNFKKSLENRGLSGKIRRKVGGRMAADEGT